MVQRKTCNYWLQGRCTFGKRCRFSHDTPSESAIGPDASRSAVAAVAGTCPYFIRGTCKFGDRCRMSHGLATETQTPPSRPFAAPKPCKFFPKGRCNKGEDCPFSHTVSNSVVLNSVPSRIKQGPTNINPPAIDATYYTRAGPSMPSFERYDDLSYIRRLQNELDKENRALSAERIKLSQTVQANMPEDSVARPDPCGHTFCRDCMRGYVRRFPILCPTCAASKGKGKGVAGEVSQTLVQYLGLTDGQFDIWAELEMASFSVLLHCRKCQRSMFKSSKCPLPDCDYVWCKQCQQTIDFAGPDHSCSGDGTSELDNLVKQQGWKYCPCTPVLACCYYHQL
ncbi:hypothetical protein H4582DRAFT_1959360 [Lactarius indigo]|nr:hypothetical protein H4582DRAFT_1959360 [Lactarius indigo]